VDKVDVGPCGSPFVEEKSQEVSPATSCNGGTADNLVSQEPHREISVNLSRPLGIFFNDTLLVEKVQPNSQAAELGVHPGCRALSVAGERVTTATEIVARLQALKKQSVQTVVLAFTPVAAPSSTAGDMGESQTTQIAEPSAMSASEAPASARPHTITGEAASKSEEPHSLEVRVDLSKSLGLGFDDGLLVKQVQPSSQAVQLGICKGWRVLSAGGEKVCTTKELVAKVQSLKKGGTLVTLFVFAVPNEDAKDDVVEVVDDAASKRPAKRPRLHLDEQAP